MSMGIENKTRITAGALVLIIILVGLFGLWPLFAEIRNSADNFVLQKNRLAELEAKKSNLQAFTENRETYQVSLERIDRLFVNIKEPVAFIEFLEEEAALAGITVEITPFAPRKMEGDPWQSMNFKLELEGDFSGIAKFLERLEYSDYLLQALNLSISRTEKGDKEIVSAALTIKVYSK